MREVSSELKPRINTIPDFLGMLGKRQVVDFSKHLLHAFSILVLAADSLLLGIKNVLAYYNFSKLH